MSFQRTLESSSLTYWIPAFAGMTYEYKNPPLKGEVPKAEGYYRRTGGALKAMLVSSPTRLTFMMRSPARRCSISQE